MIYRINFGANIENLLSDSYACIKWTITNVCGICDKFWHRRDSVLVVTISLCHIGLYL